MIIGLLSFLGSEKRAWKALRFQLPVVQMFPQT
jgi:hypothetical protein